MYISRCVKFRRNTKLYFDLKKIAGCEAPSWLDPHRAQHFLELREVRLTELE